VTTNRQDLEALIPVEVSQEVIQKVEKVSAMEQIAPPETMTSDTKQVSRFGEFNVGTVAKGAEYGFSQNTQDSVDLIARKIGGAAKVAEEDLVDTITGEGTMRRYEQEAGTALAKTFDHGTMGTTAAPNGTTVPFPSIYYTLSQASTSPWGNYTANQNILKIARDDFAGTTAQDAVVDFLAKYEESDWFDEAETFVIASPTIRSIFRKVRDADGNPVFTPPVTEGGNPTIFGYGLARTSTGARTDATMTKAPAGNPLIIIGNRQMLKRGLARTSAGMVPGNPGVQWQRAAQGIGFLSDEAIMKAMMRRAFVATVPEAFAILEITPAV
jgi:HK97 family phage major capsid protein